MAAIRWLSAGISGAAPRPAGTTRRAVAAVARRRPLSLLKNVFGVEIGLQMIAAEFTGRSAHPHVHDRRDI